MLQVASGVVIHFLHQVGVKGEVVSVQILCFLLHNSVVEFANNGVHLLLVLIQNLSFLARVFLNSVVDDLPHHVFEVLRWAVPHMAV